MTPGDPAPSVSEAHSALLALSSACDEELAVNFELWRLTGFDPKQAPPRKLWQNALWARAHLDVYEGRAPRIPADHAMWFYLDPRPEDGCGVEAFA